MKDRLTTNFQASVTMIEFVSEDITDLLVGADKLTGGASAAAAAAAPFAPTGAMAAGTSFAASSPVERRDNDSFPRAGSSNSSSGAVLSSAVVLDAPHVDDDGAVSGNDDEEDCTTSSFGGSFSAAAASETPPRGGGLLSSPRPVDSAASPIGSSGGVVIGNRKSKSSSPSGSPKGPTASGKSPLLAARQQPAVPNSKKESLTTTTTTALKIRFGGSSSGGLGVFIDGASTLAIADSTDLARVVHLGLSRREEMFLARGSMGPVAHTALVVRFQRGVLGEPVVTESELVLVDAVLPPVVVASPAAPGASSGTAAAASAGQDFYSRKGLQSASALSRLITTIASEPHHGKGGKVPVGIKPSESARTIRTAVKRESLLTKFLSERLDGNVVLYMVAHLPSTIASPGMPLPAATVASLTKLKQLQDSLVTVVDPARSVREVAVTTHVIQNDLRRLRQSLKAVQQQQQAADGSTNNSVYGKRILALKKQILQHEDRLAELRQFLSKRLLSFSRLKVRCERQRSQLETLHSELACKSTAAHELKQFSQALEESTQAHRHLVGQLHGAMQSVTEASDRLHHHRSAASLLESDTKRRAEEAMSSEGERLRQRRNFFKQIFQSATRTVQMERERQPLASAIERLAAIVRLLQVKLDVKNKKLLAEAHRVGELQQADKMLQARIMQTLSAEEAYSHQKGPEDVEIATMLDSTQRTQQATDGAREELAELDHMVSIFSPEALEAREHRRRLSQTIDTLLAEQTSLETERIQLAQTGAELQSREVQHLHDGRQRETLLAKSHGDLELNSVIGKYVHAELDTLSAEIMQRHVATTAAMHTIAGLHAELGLAGDQYDRLVTEYAALCDQHSVCGPEVFGSAKAIAVSTVKERERMSGCD